MKGHSLLPLLFVPIIILVSGCISGLDAESLAKANPIIQDFLKDHPNAEILVTHFTANQSSQMLEEIRDECANPMIEAKDYYRIRFTDEGFYAVVWVDWENKQIECAFKKGTEPGESCTSHAEYRCFGQHVYWFDSCGYKGEKKEFCEQGCDDGRCKYKKSCEEVGGYCIYPTRTPSVTGLITESGASGSGAPATSDNCEEYYVCPDGKKFRICEQVKRFDDRGNLVGVGCACKEKPEYLCTASGTIESDATGNVPTTNAVVYPECREGYGKAGFWCPGEGVCCTQDGVGCKSRAEQKCYGDHVYWFDSCGHKQEKKEYCENGCELGFCKERPSTEFCGTSTEGACNSDIDCVTSGCSGQVCQSASEDDIDTTCEWRDCYSAEKFDMGCQCVEGYCKWHKKTCDSNTETKCHDGHVYWFDSCNNKGEKKEYCDHGCENGACIAVTNETCVDTDGGRVYHTYGVVEKGSSRLTDHCNDDGSLTEKYCENNEIKAEQVNCSQGYECLEGECVLEEPINYSCTESDSGMHDYYVKGAITWVPHTTGVQKTDEDFCTNSQETPLLDVREEGAYLYEAYCEDSPYSGAFTVYECPDGCSNGACLVECTGIEMVWYVDGNEIRRDPDCNSDNSTCFNCGGFCYSFASDTCESYRCLTGSEINPSCYTAQECVDACGTECVSIPSAKEQCI